MIGGVVAGYVTTRQRGLKLGVAVMVAMATLWPSAALAHTALLGSSPATGERLAYGPQEVLLSFEAPVSISTMQATLRSADGTVVPIEMLSTDQQTEAVVFDVPALDHDVYGLAWESVGDDGHRVSGEVVFGVGTDVGQAAGFRPRADPFDRVLEAVAVLGRSIWYAALALGVGAAVLRRGTAELFRALVSRRVPTILLALGVTALLRGAIGVLTFLLAGGGATEAIISRPAAAWAGAAMLAFAVRRKLRRDMRQGGVSRDGRPSPVGLTTRTLIRVLFAMLLLSVVAGHAPSRPDPAVAVAFGVVHLGAAAAWVGPLALLALLVRTPVVRLLSPADRRSQILSAVSGIASVAGWALAAVVVSGGLLALRAWDGQGLSGAFLTTLIIKGVVILAVVVPLAALNHRRRESWSVLPRTAVVEVAGLAAVMILGGVLVGQDPSDGTTSGSANVTVAQVLDGSITEPADCAMLEVGRAACYRSALENVMVADGPQAAIDIVRDLSSSDDYVIANCHQVGHDLGNDTAENLEDLGTALSVQDQTCWSGYIHGFVEARLAQSASGDLVTELPTFCDDAATTPYNLTHYNCVHGLGHGVMLTVDGDLFESLDLCEGAGDDWSVLSCASGAFMENVIAAQSGLEAAVDPDDLLFPCTAVRPRFVDSCMSMQTSHVLWELDGDIAMAFDVCDDAREADQQTCYQSMGRDISGRTLLDAAETAELCNLGSTQLVQWCIHGAATNAVYDQIDPTAADPLCEAVDGNLATRCRAGQAEAAAIVATG